MADFLGNQLQALASLRPADLGQAFAPVGSALTQLAQQSNQDKRNAASRDELIAAIDSAQAGGEGALTQLLAINPQAASYVQQQQAAMAAKDDEDKGSFLSSLRKFGTADERISHVNGLVQGGIIDAEQAGDLTELLNLPIEQQDARIDQVLSTIAGGKFASKGSAPVALGKDQILVDPATGREVARGIIGSSDIDKEIAKETRGGLRKGVDGIKKQVEVIESNYTKLKNLVGEVKKGNRSAVAQALVSLVKLGDPGSIVKESEMISALNSTSPTAAVTKLLSSKTDNTSLVDAIAKKIDPLDPNNLNTDELLQTANALVSSNVPTIQKSYADALKQGSLLSEKGRKSIFSDDFSARVNGLSGIGGDATKPKGNLTPSEQLRLKELEAKNANK